MGKYFTICICHCNLEDPQFFHCLVWNLIQKHLDIYSKNIGSLNLAALPMSLSKSQDFVFVCICVCVCVRVLFVSFGVFVFICVLMNKSSYFKLFLLIFIRYLLLGKFFQAHYLIYFLRVPMRKFLFPFHRWINWGPKKLLCSSNSWLTKTRTFDINLFPILLNYTGGLDF